MQTKDLPQVPGVPESTSDDGREMLERVRGEKNLRRSLTLKQLVADLLDSVNNRTERNNEKKMGASTILLDTTK
ncbi:jg16635 [Pararge aegeria aegeria]|uniref:Jg16635 protein n=1 Tax=Pararge aegeria aegeria TaxID=348720 RepID=A0A8S4QH51_9NEOP|nr:jg16635 [Pararge aegeria aegeria]